MGRGTGREGTLTCAFDAVAYSDGLAVVVCVAEHSAVLFVGVVLEVRHHGGSEESGFEREDDWKSKMKQLILILGSHPLHIDIFLSQRLEHALAC